MMMPILLFVVLIIIFESFSATLPTPDNDAVQTIADPDDAIDCNTR